MQVGWIIKRIGDVTVTVGCEVSQMIGKLRAAGKPYEIIFEKPHDPQAARFQVTLQAIPVFFDKTPSKKGAEIRYNWCAREIYNRQIKVSWRLLVDIYRDTNGDHSKDQAAKWTPLLKAAEKRYFVEKLCDAKPLPANARSFLKLFNDQFTWKDAVDAYRLYWSKRNLADEWTREFEAIENTPTR